MVKAAAKAMMPVNIVIQSMTPPKMVCETVGHAIKVANHREEFKQKSEIPNP